MIGQVIIVLVVVLCGVGAWLLNRSPGTRRMSQATRERDRDISASEQMGQPPQMSPGSVTRDENERHRAPKGDE